MVRNQIKFVRDADGKEIEVIVPISVWRRLATSNDGVALLVGGEIASVSPGLVNGNEPATCTRIGIDEASGLPVFITPPGSPMLTIDDVKNFEEDW